MQTSAYMIAHCDDDFLEQAIASIINRVDELIFVDGAYKWIAPFFTAAGLDPERSWQKTHDILAKFGNKIKYFNGIWDDELHKRSFGWSQCSGDIIIRVDADEILEFDEDEYASFLMSNKAVAQMEIPFMLTSSSERLRVGLEQTPRLCAIFKTSRFRNALQHCSYLWLILTEDERKRCGPMNAQHVYEPPIIRTAHLTGMRTPRTAVNRARFYALQYVRVTGHLQWSFAQSPVTVPEEKISQIFDLLSADEYTSYLEGHDIVSGFATMQDFRVAPYDFEGTPVQAQVQAAYDAYNASLADLLDFANHPRTVVSKSNSLINITSLVRQGVRKFEIEFADQVDAVPAHLQLLHDTEEDQSARFLEPVYTHVEGKVATCSYKLIDIQHILQASLLICPRVTGPLNKTRIIRLTAIS